MIKMPRRLLFLIFTIKWDSRKITTESSAHGNAFVNKPDIFIDATIKNSGERYSAKFTSNAWMSNSKSQDASLLICMLRCPRPRPRHLAAPRSICPHYARAPLGGQMRSAPRNVSSWLLFSLPLNNHAMSFSLKHISVFCKENVVCFCCK